MKIIAGLGNPGKEYEGTRHNVGFSCIDNLALRYDIKVSRLKFHALIGEGFISNEKVLLVKPVTYMNDSGIALREIAAYYCVEAKDFIVFVDDIDIKFGELRIKRHGSAGTHNGMKSVIYHLKSDDFPRIKLGVGKKKGGEDLKNFVLGRFSGEDKKIIESLVDEAADALVEIMSEGIDKAMAKYNGRVIE